MRTEGREFVCAEVVPEIKEALSQYAAEKGFNQSEAMRTILHSFFAFKGSVKAVRNEAEEQK